MDPSILSPRTPTHMSRSSSGSFDANSINFRDYEASSPGAHESFSLGESYNETGNYNGDAMNRRYNKNASGGGGSGKWRGWVIKAVCVIGGALLLRKFTKRTTRWDHARVVAQALSGEKFSTEQAARDPMTYFNLRLLACPATVLADGGRVLYFEQAFCRTPERPFRQRFYGVKPCPKEMKCDVEVSSYAVRDIEEYRKFCERPKDQRSQPAEVLKDMAEHLSTVYLSACDRGRRCLYEGSTPPGGFPNAWNGASTCTSELSIYKNGEIHCWDRAYDDAGKQVWGVRQGPYEFKPATSSSSNGSLKQSDFPGSLKPKTIATSSSPNGSLKLSDFPGSLKPKTIEDAVSTSLI